MSGMGLRLISPQRNPAPGRRRTPPAGGGWRWRPARFGGKSTPLASWARSCGPAGRTLHEQGVGAGGGEASAEAGAAGGGWRGKGQRIVPPAGRDPLVLGNRTKGRRRTAGPAQQGGRRLVWVGVVLRACRCVARDARAWLVGRQGGGPLALLRFFASQARGASRVWHPCAGATGKVDLGGQRSAVRLHAFQTSPPN